MMALVLLCLLCFTWGVVATLAWAKQKQDNIRLISLPLLRWQPKTKRPAIGRRVLVADKNKVRDRMWIPGRTFKKTDLWWCYVEVPPTETL